MLMNYFKMLVVLLLLSTTLFAEYRYMGSFKAGESVSGLRSLQNDYSGLEYDFIVEQYGVVEFSPQEPTSNTSQYKLRDFEQKSSSGYFYVGGAEGITSHTSLTYPDGYKIALMPGTYKIIVYTSYTDVYPEDTTYSMSTSFTSSTNQAPATGTTLNQRQSDGSYANPTKAISLNTLYSDNLAYYKANSEQLGDSTSYSYVNYSDVFSFTLSEESNITRVLTLNSVSDVNTNPLYTYIRKPDGTTACSTFYTSTTGEKSSDICTLDAGEYFLEFSGSGSHSEYDFKLLSTPTTVATPVCSGFSLERDQQHINMDIGDTDYFNISVCDPVQILSSDESIAIASRYQMEFVDEVEVKAVANGSVTVTVSDANGVGYLYIDVGTDATTAITTPDTKEDIGAITFLEYEPDGYFSWSDADKFCKERTYRLPTMDELIYVWNLNGGTISPDGFKKDTFYWSNEPEVGTSSYKACAMDASCSESASWPADSYGHPKCVVSVNGSLDIDSEDNSDEPTTPTITTKANFDDFRTSYCGTYSDTNDGLQVNGSAYRYGNYLRSIKTYDVRDSITKIKWQANSSQYSQFSPTIVGITGGNMTTNHSYAGSSKIDSGVWYYTTITVDGDKTSTITAKNDYVVSGVDVVDSRESTLSDTQLNLSQKGLELGFNMGDTYASTSAYFIISEFSTTAKVVEKGLEKSIELQGSISDIFSDAIGSWSVSNNQIQITNAKLNDSMKLKVSSADAITFKASSNENQANFVVRTLDVDGKVISAVTVDPSSSECMKEYYLPLAKDVVEVEFLFTTSYSIEHYESTTKDIALQDIKLQYISYETPSIVETDSEIKDYVVTDNGDKKTINVDMGEKKPTITVPPLSDIFENSNGGITVVNTPTPELKTTTTLNENGTVISEIVKILDEIETRTRILIDLVIQSSVMDNDGSSILEMVFGNFKLNLSTDTTAKVTPNYSINGKDVAMPTFDSGSRVYVTTDTDDVIIEIQTKLTSKITFQK